MEDNTASILAKIAAGAKYKATVTAVLRGPDGEVKLTRTTENATLIVEHKEDADSE